MGDLSQVLYFTYPLFMVEKRSLTLLVVRQLGEKQNQLNHLPIL